MPLLMAGCTIIPPADAPEVPPPPPPPVDAPAGGDTSPIPEQAPDETLTYAALGQTVRIDGPSVTPIAVLEDSRCPMNARCVWAGQVRLSLRIGRGETIEITSGKPIHVADGTLELVETRPDKMAGGAGGGGIEPAAYRFGFRFRGGY